MGKKPQQQRWPEAIRLCRLNRNDVEMAKRLGFRPETLVRARPGPNDKWRLPVNVWVRELHRQRFGGVLGQKSLPAPVTVGPQLNQEDMRRFEEELYWEDYWARNEDDSRPQKSKGSQVKPAKAPDAGATPCLYKGVGNDSVPFPVDLAPNRPAGRSGARRVAPSIDATAGHGCTSES